MPYVAIPASQGNQQYSGAAVASRTLTAAGPVLVGDTLAVAVFHDTFNASAAVMTDDLGNLYVQQTGVTQPGDKRRVAVYRGLVTVPGTPTLTLQFLPSPGSTTVTVCETVLDVFRGSNTVALVDLADFLWQTTPGAGANAVLVNIGLRHADGELLYGASGASTGTAPAPGTGYTGAQATAAMQSQYKLEGTAGSGAVTWTGDVGSDYLSAVFTAYAGVIVDDSDQTVVMITQAPTLEVSPW